MNHVNLSALAAVTLLFGACDSAEPERSSAATTSAVVSTPPSTRVAAWQRQPSIELEPAPEREPAPPPRAEIRPTAVSRRDLPHLLSREPGASHEQYRARTVTFRLFGIQAGDEVPFATLADTSTWATRNIRPGDRLARNLQVVEIGDDAVTIRGAGGLQKLRVGEDVALRLIHHIVDEAAVYRGKHRFDADLEAMRLVRDRYGLGADTSYASKLDHDGVELANVRSDGLLSKLDLRDGDLISRVNDRPVTEENVSQLLETLTTKGTHSLLVVRAHNVLPLKVRVAESEK